MPAPPPPCRQPVTFLCIEDQPGHIKQIRSRQDKPTCEAGNCSPTFLSTESRRSKGQLLLAAKAQFPPGAGRKDKPQC